MKLGVISKVLTEDAFKSAKELGLDFVEFCINGGSDSQEFFSAIPSLIKWSREYGVEIGSIGRWKANILMEDGAIDPEEQKLALELMDAAHELGSPNYICGCNYVDGLSYYQNCTQAIAFFSKLLENRPEGVEVSTYNCRKGGNFVADPMAWTVVHGHLPDLGIKYDPSHARYAGGDYLKETSDWGHRFRHVHLKGSMIVDGQRIDDPPAGLDDTNWPVFFSLLRARGYDGNLSIEPHSSVWSGDLGDQGLRYTVAYMNKLLFRGEQI